jgi:hypothetical protein
VVTTGNDATNVYIILSARVLNPDLYIVSRAADDASVTKLVRAGANRAISPYAIGGHRLAHLILRPAVVDFFETALRAGEVALNIEDVAVTPESPTVGQTLGALDIRRVTGVTVLAILRGGNPGEPARSHRTGDPSRRRAAHAARAHHASVIDLPRLRPVAGGATVGNGRGRWGAAAPCVAGTPSSSAWRSAQPIDFDC